MSINLNKKKIQVYSPAILACLAVFALMFFPSVSHAEDGVVASTFKDAIAGIIFAVYTVIALVQTAVAVLFGWIVDAGNWTLMNSAAVKDIWTNVRDFLNMFFILVLLFAAFCTIFQIDKWSLKKVWLSILINALLVNFSFSIARFIIDISNIMMYYLLQNMFSGDITTGAGIMSQLSDASNISKVLVPGSTVNGNMIPYLIAATIFSFIFTMTLVVLAVLFLIRLIVLIVIVMFSPVGFVANIFPGMAKYADQWWTSLFKNAFSAPIMVFMMAVAIKMMQTIQSSEMAEITAQARNQTPNDVSPNWIASLAFYAIPIAILWIGMGISQKLGAEGGKYAVSQGMKLKKWAQDGSKYAWKQTGIPGGYKKGMENARKSGQLFGKNIPLLKDTHGEREAKFAGLIGGGPKGWKDADKNRKIKEFGEKAEETKGKYDSDSAADLVTKIRSTEITDSKSALEVAGKYKHLMSDSLKKQEFEDEIKTLILADQGYQNLGTAEEKDIYMKKEINKQWSTLRSRFNTAKKHYSEGTVDATFERDLNSLGLLTQVTNNGANNPQPTGAGTRPPRRSSSSGPSVSARGRAGRRP